MELCRLAPMLHNHMLRNDLIRLPVVRCEFGEMNAKYQMHLRLRNLANPKKKKKKKKKITTIQTLKSLLTLWEHPFIVFLNI